MISFFLIAFFVATLGKLNLPFSSSCKNSVIPLLSIRMSLLFVSSYY
nr:MAG TPA: hypothetical protein [Caudoviricetes sp.]